MELFRGSENWLCSCYQEDDGKADMNRNLDKVIQTKLIKSGIP